MILLCVSIARSWKKSSKTSQETTSNQTNEAKTVSMGKKVHELVHIKQQKVFFLDEAYLFVQVEHRKKKESVGEKS